MKRYTFLLLILIGLTSCSRPFGKSKILSKQEFVSVLVDIHTFDAIVTDYTLNSYTVNLDSLSIYSSIMEKHHTTGESFRATMQWYSARPEKLSAVYDEVFGVLTKREQELNDELKLFNSPNLKTLYSKKDFILFRGDTARFPEPIIISTEGKGTYLVDIQLRMLSDDKSINPKIVASFIKDEKEQNPKDKIIITESVIQKSNFSRDYQSSVELIDESYKFIKLIVPQTDNSDSVFFKNLQISSIRVSFVIPTAEKDSANVKSDGDISVR